MMMKETTETLWATNDFTSFQLYSDWVCSALTWQCPKDLQIACPLTWQASSVAGSRMKASDMKGSCTYYCCHLGWKVRAVSAQGTKTLAPGHMSRLRAARSALAGDTYPSVGCPAALAVDTYPTVAHSASSEDG